MAENKDIEQNIILNYKTNADGTAKEVNKVVEATDKSVRKNKENTASVKETNTTIEQTSKVTKQAEESTKSLAGGFKKAGVALKAIGIGLLISAVAILSNLFQQNQKIANGLSIAMKALSLAFNDLFSFVEKSIGKVTGYFKELFENPKEKLIELGDAIQANLIERFNSFIDTLGFAFSALTKLFKGDFKGAAEDIGNAYKESIDILTGVNNSVDRLTTAVADYSKEMLAAAEAMVDLENRTKIAIAQNQGLIEQYDRLAEQQRQIRDDESATIEDRIAANDKLGGVLEDQRKKMLANADLTVQSAALTYNQNKTIENQVALIEAQNEKKAILAQIEGFVSEQKVNQIALEKELNELNQTAIDGVAAREIANKKFTTSLIKDNTDRLESQINALNEEYELELKRLEDKRSLYKEGTQAYADTNEEVLNLQNTFNQNLATAERTLAETILAEKQLATQSVIDNERLAFELRYAALDEQFRLLNEQEFASEEERNIAFEALSNKRIEIDQAELEQRQKNKDDILATGDALIAGAKMLSGKNKALQRTAIIAEGAMALGKVGVNIATGVSKDAATGAVASVPQIAKTLATGVFAATSIISNTSKALSAVGGGSAGGSSAGGSTSPNGGAIPQVEFQTSSENQIGNTLARNVNDTPPVQAFVVSSEVTTAQALDRNRVDSNSF